MGAGDDFFFTGGGFSDWSGGSAGKFSSGSSSGGSSGGGGSNNSDPNDWKYGCGCFVAIVVGVLLYFWADVWDWINYKLFYRSDDIEVIEEQCDTTMEWVNDTVIHVYEPSVPVECAMPKATSSPKANKVTTTNTSTSKQHSRRSSRSYYYDDDDEYDEDGMYKDEDEDIKDKRQYDDWDDDEADDWE